MFKRKNTTRSAVPDEFDLQSYSFVAPTPSPPATHHHNHHHFSQPPPQPYQPAHHYHQPPQPQPQFTPSQPPQFHHHIPTQSQFQPYQPPQPHHIPPQPHTSQYSYQSFHLNDGYEPMDTSPDDVPFYDADSDWQPMCF